MQTTMKVDTNIKIKSFSQSHVCYMNYNVRDSISQCVHMGINYI